VEQVSLTVRDEPTLKGSCSDTSNAAPTSDDGDETMNDPACPASDVLATLCRMSLLRDEPLAVSGGYARSPPQHD
jgi:hypothetical protein